MVLITVSILLALSFTILIIQMKRYFAAQMVDEARRIKTMYVCFTVSSISRAVVFLLCRHEVIKEYNQPKVYFSLYFFWDFIPLSLVMYYHYHCFTAQEEIDRMRENQVQDEILLRSSTTGSTMNTSSSHSTTFAPTSNTTVSTSVNGPSNSVPSLEQEGQVHSADWVIFRNSPFRLILVRNYRLIKRKAVKKPLKNVSSFIQTSSAYSG